MQRSAQRWIVSACLAVGAVVAWRCGHHEPPSIPRATAMSGASGQLPLGDAHREAATGAIAGTIRDDTGTAIARARVCADALVDPHCASSDDHGAYAIGELRPAWYEVTASAPTYRPAVFRPDGESTHHFALAAGEHRNGVDLVLRRGGVEVTGVVRELGGAPIAHALVRAGTSDWNVNHQGHWGAAVESDARGRFSLWVDPGELELRVSADGYATVELASIAPGAAIDVLLTPGSTLAGIVVDRDGKPVEDAEVAIDSDRDTHVIEHSDAEGRFQVTGLLPGRYTGAARTPHAYGRTAGSIGVGLGAHVGGVEIRLHPAFRVSGRVVIDGAKLETCPHAEVTLHDGVRQRDVELVADPGGTLHADAITPATYELWVHCRGYDATAAPALVVDRDRDHLEWIARAGATIRGHVVGRDGAPRGKLGVSALAGTAMHSEGFGDADTAADGSFAIAGLPPGTYRLDVAVQRVTMAIIRGAEPVEVARGATLQRELVIDDAGGISGFVMDSEGHAVPGVTVAVAGEPEKHAVTENGGDFIITSVRPGSYHVAVSLDDRVLRKIELAVRAGETAVTRIVVDPETGTIRGDVVDAAGKPVANATIATEREAAWSWTEPLASSQHPTVTAADGTFAVTQLAPGSYNVHAYRDGGGEAIVQHVAVGATTHLRISDGGTIDGTVTYAPSGAPDEIELKIRDKAAGFFRAETFYLTDGAFAVHDLPAGQLTVTAQAIDGTAAVEVVLGVGDHKTVQLSLVRSAGVIGRLVDLETQVPLPNRRVIVRAVGGEGGVLDTSPGSMSAEDGRFRIAHAPSGKIWLTSMAADPGDRTYAWTRIPLTVSGSGAVDLGDIPLVRSRLHDGQHAGTLGFAFVDPAGADVPRLEVASIDPDGPAAKTELRVGDVVVAIDGIDVTGDRTVYAKPLLAAPAGTSAVLALASGVTVTIELAP